MGALFLFSVNCCPNYVLRTVKWWVEPSSFWYTTTQQQLPAHWPRWDLSIFGMTCITLNLFFMSNKHTKKYFFYFILALFYSVKLRKHTVSTIHICHYITIFRALNHQLPITRTAWKRRKQCFGESILCVYLYKKTKNNLIVSLV